MTEISKTEAAVKPVATIKTPVVTPEVKLAVATVKEEVKKTEPKAVIEKKVEPKKPAAKKAAAPKKAVAKKAEPKAAEKKTEAKKAVAKKPAAKKAAAPKKTAAKKPAAKKTTTAKAADVNVSIELQYSYKHVTYDELIQNAKNHYQYEMGGNVDEIKSLSIYVKPQEDAAYYVVNDKVQSRIGL